MGLGRRWIGRCAGTSLRRGLLSAMACMGAASALAQAPILPELRQQERERALREQLEHDERRRPKAAEPPALGRLPADEVPCHRLDTITLHGQDSEDFQWLLSHIDGENGDDSPIGRCLGAQGINTVLARMGRALVSRGWGATQVLAPVSGIQNGILPLKLLPGRAVALRFAEKGSEPTSLRNAIPIDPCALIRLEDVEQGVENLNRVPTAEANIRFKPFEGEGAKPGDSEILVDYKQARHLRATLSLDDSGTKATGRHQAGATVSIDNPLGLNDLFYVSANHSVDARHFLGNDKRGTESQVLHYSVPCRKRAGHGTAIQTIATGPCASPDMRECRQGYRREHLGALIWHNHVARTGYARARLGPSWRAPRLQARRRR